MRQALRCARPALIAFLLLARLAGAACKVEAVASLAPTDPSGSPTNVRIFPAAAPSDGAALNVEGLAERLSDVLIYDDGLLPNCFAAANTITIVYSVAVTTPGSLSDLTSSGNLDRFDSLGALDVSASGSMSFGQTTVTLTVLSAGTSGDLTAGGTGSAVRIKNLRADVTPLPTLANVTASLAANPVQALASTQLKVGIVFSTIRAGAAITKVGSGSQSSGKTLDTAATFSFAEGFTVAFRVAGTSGVSADLAAGATSLIFDAGASIPPGVTVTFPTSIQTSGSALVFTLRSGGVCGPLAGNCVAIYDASGNSSALATTSVTTAGTPRIGDTSSGAAIGVQIGNVSGAGTATLHAFFGPAGTAGSANDDVNAGASPRYVANNGASGLTRNIFNGTWFSIAATAPNVLLSATSLAFGNQNVGSTSATQPVIVTNTGPLPLTIAGITASSGFSQTSACPVAGLAQLGPGSSCEIDVAFAPTAAGPRSGLLTITDNAPGSPQTVALSGSGVGVNPLPHLTSLNPASISAGINDFNLTLQGSAFIPQSSVLWNGSPRLTIYVSATQLLATILATDVANTGTAGLTVSNPAPGGGVSNPLTLTIGANPLTNAPFTYFLPHAVSGGGYATKITIVNINNAQNAIELHWVSQAGALLDSANYTVAAGGTLRVSTPEADRFAGSIVKWAVVGTQLPAAVNIFFEYIATPGTQVVNSLGFNPPAPGTSFSAPVEFQPAPAGWNAGRTAGLAVANTIGASTSVTLQLVNSAGVALATTSLTLPPFGQASLDLSQVAAFKAKLPAGDFVGSLTISATGNVAAIALQDDFGPFSAVPLVPGKAK